MTSPLPDIIETRRLASPCPTPQALAWHRGTLWIGSRDGRRFYGVNPQTWETVEEAAAPGIPWAAVSEDHALLFTSGEGPEDDRYLRRYEPGRGIDDGFRVPLPEFTGSYVSSDGKNLYLSQWYKHRLLRLDPANGAILQTVPIGAEISGHAFANGTLYVLRGTEQDGENWYVSRVDLRGETPQVEDLARVPFACRSLTFDGERFWTNHRAADQTVSFELPTA